jgi:AcrR family transcriptional regulator
VSVPVRIVPQPTTTPLIGSAKAVPVRGVVRVAPRRRRHLERTRQDILTATSEVVTEAGYQGSRIEEICTRAGISRGAFYHHFPSKEAAIVALIERDLSPLLEAHRRIEELTTDDRFRMIALQIAAVMRWVRSGGPVARAYLIDMTGVPEVEGLRERIEGALEAQMFENLEPLAAAGDLTSTDLMSTVRAFAGMTREMAIGWVLGRVADADLALREVVRLAMLGVGVSPARAETLAEEASSYQLSW